MRAVAEHDCDARKLDFCIIHAGEPRVFDDLIRFLDAPVRSLSVQPRHAH
ncbi:hypothetical protein Sviol_48320 [Streptomyces violascens]|uniref:Uncharacterized protein n=1 Tax=Streptomyces violascens TaxID=67381 RepID=A0ABQ3QT05_9ACTN|nr:hypothetical protein Sviol_48320 [Streptomyces violascens]